MSMILQPPTRFVLIEPSHAGNVGAVARAMKVMGFEDLVLVRPRWADVLTREEAKERASGADDLLEKARIVDTLDEALVGMTHLCATAMTPRNFGPPTRAPRDYLPELAQTPEIGGVAFLFGTERFGMKNEDVYRSHVALSIPANPRYGSLNLAAALQVIAYEWRMALGGFPIRPAPLSVTYADANQVAGLLSHLEQALTEINFLDPATPKKLMPRLNAMFNRAQLTMEEVHILRGVAKAILETITRARR